MSRKKLYIFGDSWTDDTYAVDQRYAHELSTKNKNELNNDKISRVSYTWGKYVSDLLDADLGNFAIRGDGNWRIQQNILNKIFVEQKQIDIVMVLWSEPVRSPFGCWTLKPYSPRRTDNHDFIAAASKVMQDEIVKIPEKRLRLVMKFIYKDFVNQITGLCRIFEERNIEYIMAMGFHPHIGPSNEISFDYFNKIWQEVLSKSPKMPENVIGWPFVKDFGGWNMSDKLGVSNRWSNSTDQHFFDTSYHPNKSGHLLIADEMLKGYDKIYGK